MHVMVVPRGLYGVPRLPFAGVFERHQVAALRLGGVDVGVLSGGVITTRHLGRRFPYASSDVFDGVVVYRAPRRAYLPARWQDPLNSAKRSYRLVRQAMDHYLEAQGRPDVIHAHNHVSGGVLARLIHEDYGIPYVITEHSSIYISDPSAVVRARPAIDHASEKAARVIAVSEHLARHLRPILPADVAARMTVVPNVLDPTLQRRPLAVPGQGPITIGALGNLVPGKNYGLLLRSFARADLPEGTRLVIGGDGPQRGALISEAESLGIADRVTFAGPLDRDGVAKLLEQSTIFAHTSDFESFGVVLIEALACGVPVVSTASGGPDDIVTPDLGRLVPVHDADGFARALAEVARDRAMYSSMTIRNTVRERFGPETFARTMTGIYEEAAS